MLSPIIAGIIAAIVSGAISYFIGLNFWYSKYARTNKLGDGGGPFGGVFVIMSGAIVTLLFLRFYGYQFLDQDQILSAIIGGMGASVFFGIIPLFRSRRPPKEK